MHEIETKLIKKKNKRSLEVELIHDYIYQSMYANVLSFALNNKTIENNWFQEVLIIDTC